MIVDHIQNAKKYYPLGDRMATALRYLEQTDFSTLETGRHGIRGEQIYAMIQRYKPRQQSEATWEAHRKYADIQYIVSGSELMGFSPVQTLTTLEPYDDDKDAEQFTGDGDFIAAMPGMFFILEPDDAHMPSIVTRDGQAADMTKVVVKVAV